MAALFMIEGEENGIQVGKEIRGYAYAHRHMERQAYQWNAELSIYVDRVHTSQGIGRKLYGGLLNLLQLQGIRTVYGGVTLPNERSCRLHLSLGFRRLCICKQAGYKLGAWHDVAWFERTMGDFEATPLPLVPFPKIDGGKVREILKNLHGSLGSVFTTGSKD